MQDVQPGTEVKQAVQGLWKTIRSTGEIIVSIREDNSRLSDRLSILEQENNAKSDVIGSLEQNIRDMRHDMEHIEELRAAMKALDAKYEETRLAAEEKDAQIHSLKEELSQLREERDALYNTEAKVKELHEENTRLSSELTAALTTIDEQKRIDEKKRELEEVVNALNNDLLRKNSEIEDYLREREESALRLQELEAAEKSAQSLSEEVSKLKDEHQQLQRKHAELQEYAQRQSAAALEYKAELDEMAAKMYETEKDLGLARKRIEEVEGALSRNDYEAVFQQREQQLHAQIESYQQQVADLQDDLSALNTAVDTLRVDQSVYEERDKLKKINNDLEEQLAQLRTEVQKLKTEVATQSAVKDDSLLDSDAEKKYKEHISYLLDEITGLRRELELGEHASQQKQQRIAELTDEVIELKQQFVGKERKYENFHKIIEEHNAEHEKRVHRFEKEKNEALNALTQARLRIIELEDEVRHELERNISLKKELRAGEEANISEELEREISALKEERSEYLRQLAELRENHSNVVQQLSTLNGDASTELQQLAVRVRDAIGVLQQRMEHAVQSTEAAPRSSSRISSREKQQLLGRISNLVSVLNDAVLQNEG